VSFNGKSFDAPLLETRCLYHRLAWFGVQLPHVDVLHPARQFWKRPDCSLLALEEHLVGHRRLRDVPGFEIPGRYFQFVRTGDARPLGAVLEHNRLDLLSLAALMARLLDLAQRGPAAARDAREALALGHVFARAGLDARARDAYERSIALSRAPAGAFDPVRIEALRALALAWRHQRRFDDASRCWRALLDTGGCPASVAAEAAEALAIHNEHRLRDLEAARAFAVQNLEIAEGRTAGERAGKDWTRAVAHRLARIDRKLARPTAPRSSSLSLPLPLSSAAPTSEPRTSW
jgi:tetratricopeptide (TPR) repeat protein